MDGATLQISSSELYACSRMTAAPQVLDVARADASSRDGAFISGNKGRDQQHATTEIDRG
jgi:hypothetical protein